MVCKVEEDNIWQEEKDKLFICHIKMDTGGKKQTNIRASSAFEELPLWCAAVMLLSRLGHLPRPLTGSRTSLNKVDRAASLSFPTEPLCARLRLKPRGDRRSSQVIVLSFDPFSQHFFRHDALEWERQASGATEENSSRITSTWEAVGSQGSQHGAVGGRRGVSEERTQKRGNHVYLRNCIFNGALPAARLHPIHSDLL